MDKHVYDEHNGLWYEQISAVNFLKKVLLVTRRNDV